MISIDRHDRKKYSQLFQGYEWNYLPDAILDGFMGEVLVDDEDNPQVAVLELPKLKLFIPGGDANHPVARMFMQTLPKFSALIFTSEEWEGLLKEIRAGKFIGIQRYAFTSEKLDIEHLQNLALRIPNGYRLKQVTISVP